MRPLYIIAIGFSAFAKRLAATMIACLLRLVTLRNPITEEVFRHMRDRGFMLRELTTSVGHGCNEFVFERINDTTGQQSGEREPTTTRVLKS